MVAPIDATVTVDAGGDAIVLRLNFRTLALAAQAGVDLLSGEKRELNPYQLTAVVAAFAKAEQPDFDEEQAFALMMRHGPACGAAVSKLLADFSATIPKGDAPRPPKRQGSRSPS